MHKSSTALSLGVILFSGWCSAQTFMTGQAARAVIGQPTLSSQNFGASNTILGAVGGVGYVNNTLFVADANRIGLTPTNNRVLIYNNIQQQIPPANQEIPPFSGRCPVCGGVASVVVGQPDFTTTTQVTPPTASSLRLPLAVASDGQTLAVADTSNNRVLIWKSIPQINGQAADVVLGQADFTSVSTNTAVTASSLRGPQGVWIQNGKLFVADTQNNRVLIWNSIPNRNNQPADVVLGQPDFTTAPPINQVNLSLTAAANIMLSPASVTSDGTRLYVADLGYNRVLIWNSIPSTNQKPADVEIGQVDFTGTTANDSAHLCASNGTDTKGNPTYPQRCAATINFPRYALSDGVRLFVADGGNDRVLVYNSIPTQNGARADVILGEPDEFSDVVSSNNPLTVAAADVTPTPTSLAWDGQNLYVADPTDYRILIFSPGSPTVPLNSAVNAASKAVYAAGSVLIGGTITAKDTVTVAINGTNYVYTVQSNDTTDTVAKGITALLEQANGGAGDPNVFAYEETGLSTVRLIARQPGPNGDNITLSATVSNKATLTATASGANLTGGGSAGHIAPGTDMLLRGTGLSDGSAAADVNALQLPFELAGTQVYVDGMRLGLFYVTPTEIKAQFPFAVTGAVSASAWVRVKHADGSVTITNAIGIPVVEQNPGIFADETPGATEPRRAIAMHGSSFATGTVQINGSTQVGDTASLTVGDKTYSYTVASGDALTTVRDNLISQILADAASPVTAYAVPQGTTIRLQAKVPGPAGNGIPLSTSTSTLPTNNQGVQITLTATNSSLCCANVAFAPLTVDNPALPGETIIVYTTGMGMITPDQARLAIVDGQKYQGPVTNTPPGFITATADNANATVLSASLVPGLVGIYQVILEISNSVNANPIAQLTIAQGANASNIVTIPVGAPPPAPTVQNAVRTAGAGTQPSGSEQAAPVASPSPAPRFRPARTRPVAGAAGQ
jgi:uncharacterized protein (TIGR03437 family)